MAIFSQSKMKKLLILGGVCVLLMSGNALNSFATTTAEQESSYETEITNPTRAAIWVFKVKDGYVYKRLYYPATGQWIGDWILVGPL